MSNENLGPSLYWRWDKKLSPALCKVLLEELDRNKFITSKVIQGPEVVVVDKKRRTCNTQFLDANHWLEGIMFNHVRYANQSAGWNYNLGPIERVQVAEYTIGGFYNWHEDEKLPGQPKAIIRKLSAVALLNDPSEFEGSGLFIEGIKENLLPGQGDIIVFPSYLRHRVKPVESGVRYSAAMWVQGPAFI